MPRVSYDYTSLRPNSRSPWMYFSTILSGSKPGLWQVVVTFFFPASPFSPRRNVIAGVHSSLSSSSSHSSPRQLADRFFMGGGMASNFLSFASATCSFPGAVVEAFAASPQSPCRLIQEKDSCAAETIGGVGPSAGLEASLAQRSVCNQSELQRLSRLDAKMYICMKVWGEFGKIGIHLPQYVSQEFLKNSSSMSRAALTRTKNQQLIRPS